MTDGGRRGDSNIAALPAIARLSACESARGPDADRHVKILIHFAVKGALSGAYSHHRPHPKIARHRDARGQSPARAHRARA